MILSSIELPSKATTFSPSVFHRNDTKFPILTSNARLTSIEMTLSIVTLSRTIQHQILRSTTTSRLLLLVEPSTTSSAFNAHLTIHARLPISPKPSSEVPIAKIQIRTSTITLRSAPRNSVRKLLIAPILT